MWTSRPACPSHTGKELTRLATTLNDLLGGCTARSSASPLWMTQAMSCAPRAILKAELDLSMTVHGPERATGNHKVRARDGSSTSSPRTCSSLLACGSAASPFGQRRSTSVISWAKQSHR